MYNIKKVRKDPEAVPEDPRPPDPTMLKTCFIASDKYLKMLRMREFVCVRVCILVVGVCTLCLKQ